MNNYYLGWGSGYYSGDTPHTSPYSRTNSGLASSWKDEVSFGFDPTYDSPNGGDLVKYTATVYPAGGGPVETKVLSDTSDPTYGYELYRRDPILGTATVIYAGVHKITATVNGVACKNALFTTVTQSDELYGAMSWYAEDEPGQPVNFWSRFVNTEEVA